MLRKQAYSAALKKSLFLIVVLFFNTASRAKDHVVAENKFNQIIHNICTHDSVNFAWGTGLFNLCMTLPQLMNLEHVSVLSIVVIDRNKIVANQNIDLIHPNIQFWFHVIYQMGNI